MEEVGIDIGKLKPKLLTHDLVRKADMVITMGCGAEACHLIERAVDWGIEDPKDKPIERIREVREIVLRVAGKAGIKTTPTDLWRLSKTQQL